MTPEEKEDARYVAIWTGCVVVMIVVVFVISHMMG
jgi:hypothetical protein